MVCVEREVDQHRHRERGPAVLRRGAARRRGVHPDRNWSLLITFMQARPARISPGWIPCPARSTGSSSARGSWPPAFIERLAARVPVVVIAGTPGERAADVVAADNFSGSAAIITHLIADHGKRRLFHLDGPPNSPDASQRRLGPGVRPARAIRSASWSARTQGIFSVPQRRAGRARTCWSRYRDGAAGRGRVRQRPDGDRGPAGVRRRPACASPRRWPWSASTTSAPAACTTPADHRAPAHAHAGRAGLRPPAGPDRRPGPVPHRGAAADRAGAAVELRLFPATVTARPSRR